MGRRQEERPAAREDAGRAMRIAVLGPGGVGGLLAGLLARGGDVVTCLAGETTAATLRSQGITVRSDRFGAFTVPVLPLPCSRNPWMPVS